METENITKSYGGDVIIQDVTVRVGYGECVTLLGASGIGKTTLFNVLSGLEKPDTGRVLLDGADVTAQSGLVGYMQQEDLLLPFRNILDNVTVPLRLQGQTKKAAREKALPLFDTFGILGTERKYPAQLSGGMRQRAALLRSYLLRADLMLLDEPFSALDALTKTAMHAWFIGITKKQGITTLLISHDIDEAILLSNRIYLMASRPGRITAELAIAYDGARNGDFAVSGEFMRYKKEIAALLTTKS